MTRHRAWGGVNEEIYKSINGPPGSLPPQLFKYIDMSRISQAVAWFRKFRVVITDKYNIIKKTGRVGR